MSIGKLADNVAVMPPVEPGKVRFSDDTDPDEKVSKLSTATPAARPPRKAACAPSAFGVLVRRVEPLLFRSSPKKVVKAISQPPIQALGADYGAFVAYLQAAHSPYITI
jgi:hypothetical protein